MKRIVFLFVFLMIIFARADLYCICPVESGSGLSDITQFDTLKKKQILYNGILWSNKYRRIKGDQFLYSNLFLSGTVSINSQIFKNLRIKYDIYSDEILTPMNREEIIQLNKEKVDSFIISFENRVNKFIKIETDTLKGFNGYVNVLYKGKSAIYVKYKKEISLSITEQNDGEFFQTYRIYLMKDNIVYPITGTNDFFNVLNEDKVQIRDFIRKNKLKVSKKIPESFVPLIRYYDSLRK
ncbi:MAG TPA: hypothetical protein VIK14_07515 [Ignavibacteria bacterium]